MIDKINCFLKILKNPIKYISKKLYNAKLNRQQIKRIKLLHVLKDNKRSVNQKWWMLINGRELLSEAEFNKWHYFLANYEKFRN